MNTKKDVEAFLAEKTLAVAGVSRDPQSFSSTVFRDLKGKGFRLIPVNPHAPDILGEKCYPSLGALPAKPAGVVIFTQPSETEKVVRDAIAAGIRKVWIQQGAQSPAAVKLCADSGLQAVTGRCIMMFADPAGLHNVHRWLANLFGTLPK